MILDLSNWHWPQFYLIFVWLVKLVYNIINHGKKKEHEFNAFSTLVYIAIMAWFFTVGGFFE